jgi:hypothetical protein
LGLAAQHPTDQGHALLHNLSYSIRAKKTAGTEWLVSRGYLASANTARHAQPIRKSRPPIGVMAPNIPTLVSASA